MSAALSPATGASVWDAGEMRASKRWIYEVTDDDKAELDRALAFARQKRLRVPFGKDDFPLAQFGAKLSAAKWKTAAASC